MKAVKEQVSDLKLIERFRKGSIEAFEELLGRYEAKIFNLAMRFTRNQEDAEEVLQDVFATLYRKLEGFEGKSAFSSWLYRIIVNAAFMKLRKRKQDHTVGIEDLSPAMRQICVEGDSLSMARSDTISVTRELREILQAAVQKLPGQYRAVFILRDVDGLSNQEVGEILKLSIPAVKSRLHRSRLMLRKRLQRYYDDFTGVRADVPLKHLAAANA
ncbi:MAG: sigma-70 family RNA polymerase sigma factor [Oligoflexia bacterium]|nr:sigma-70 family RNA polymerase sigma factor [Oligoflexia bacterium]